MEVVNQLVMMGVPELSAKHAAHNTAGAGAEAACEWFYMNIENPDLQGPLPKVKVGGGAQVQAQGPDPESMMMLTSMGISEKQAKRALRKCDQNLERAAEFAFSHMDDPDSEDEAQPMEVDSNVEDAFCNKDESNGKYNLQSFITHLGASVHSGHYVAHVRQEGSKWTYFNDAKVA
jgi:ubiquitin carboxyl-terminal hydrolase 5/13